MVPVVGLVTGFELKSIFPLPLAPSPMAELVFVQLKVGLPDPVKFTSTGSKLQTVILGGSSSVGLGLMVMVKLTGGPSQDPRVGMMVTLEISGSVTSAAVKLRVLFPEAPSPVLGLSLVQE